jgi:hypothetical protein
VNFSHREEREARRGDPAGLLCRPAKAGLLAMIDHKQPLSKKPGDRPAVMGFSTRNPKL